VFCERPLRWRSVVRAWGALAAGVVPFVILVGLLQNEMYGSPLKSGYGDLRLLFKVEHVWPNLQRYSSLLLQTETPVVLLALATPWLMRDPLSRRRAIWLLAFAGAVFACYIPYEVFDAWWYLRFVLPAYPALLVLTAAALTVLLSRTGALWHPVGFAAVQVLTVVLVREGVKRHAFGLWEFERRFRLAGEYVASRLPENAIVITAQESGSIRFYSDRPTLVWRALPADGLDQALTFVRAHGYRPYLLIETGEQPEFVQQFEGKTSLGGLGLPPLADINHMLRIYDRTTMRGIARASQSGRNASGRPAGRRGFVTDSERESRDSRYTLWFSGSARDVIATAKMLRIRCGRSSASTGSPSGG
jgi:hypothetical protein